MIYQLLIVSHMPSDNTRRLTEAVYSGATHKDIDNVEARLLSPFDTTADDVLACNAIILGTTENFGYMSGALKDFFDRIYYPCLELTQALPYALFIRAGNDGQGTQTSVERIVTGLKWRQVQAPLICRGEFQSDFIEQCQELGKAMAAGLELGAY